MRFRRTVGHFILLGAFAGTVGAQTTDSLIPRGGTWGAEFTPLFSGGALLRFASPTRAWLAGLDFSTSNRDQSPAPNAAGGYRLSNFRGQIGHRWYRATSGGERAAHLRVIYGLGVIGTIAETAHDGTQDYRQWSAGGYGELGAAWFFTRHVSLGAVSQLIGTNGRERSTVTTIQPDLTRIQERVTVDTWGVGASAVRVVAAVYF
jgi:hypothetical protein